MCENRAVSGANRYDSGWFCAGKRRILIELQPLMRPWPLCEMKQTLSLQTKLTILRQSLAESGGKFSQPKQLSG
jgi:hypothetical protein